MKRLKKGGKMELSRRGSMFNSWMSTHGDLTSIISAYQPDTFL